MKTKIGMLFLAMSAFFFGSLVPALQAGADVEPKNLTLEEFDNLTFNKFTKVEYQGQEYELLLVNLEERLFGLKEEEGVYWVRAENCKILNS